MGASNLASTQREKEIKILKRFLFGSVVGSIALHAIVLAASPPNLQPDTIADVEQEIEVVADTSEPEAVEPEVAEPEVAEPEATTAEEIPQEVAFAPDIAPPPVPTLAPESQAPQPVGEDAPSKQPPALAPADPVSPMTSTTGGTNVSTGSGPVFNPNGNGSGFGNATQPTGFVPEGKPNGVPDGKPGGLPGGSSNSTATREATPAAPITLGKPQCLNCPKPRYRGREGTPRVTYDIAPDGRVINVRLRRSSGDPNTDRETLEAMSKWRFDPKTVPEGGQRNVRVRVTFEEEGSRFQRENEQRRREQEEQRRIAEQQRQREAEQKIRQTPATATEPTATPDPKAPIQPAAEPPSAPVTPVTEPEPASPPAEAPPAPIETAPPSEPAPIETQPEPASVEVAPPPEPEAAPPPASNPPASP